MPAKPNDGEKNPKRGPGRPKKAERPVTPGVLIDIHHRFIRGQSIRKIGRAIGIAHGTVEHHLNHTIKPLCQEPHVAVGYSEMGKLIGQFGADIPVGTVAVDRILAVEQLSATEKLVLIALCRQPPEADVTGAELAAAASVHRVTVVKILTALRARGFAWQTGPQRWRIDWRVVNGDSPEGTPSGDWRDNDRKLRDFKRRMAPYLQRPSASKRATHDAQAIDE